MTTEEYLPYVGNELELFSQAVNWRSYWASKLISYLGGRVLEVGAGIGTNTKNLYYFADSWTALEPDPEQSAKIIQWVEDSKIGRVQVTTGTLSCLARGQQYDAILYIDVLEHIANDSGELENAYSLLAPGGVVIILSPAHNFLYTSFDRSIGHYRRYGKKQLLRLKPSLASVEFTGYLDSAGLIASFGNKIFLRSSMPGKRQILFWDNMLIPLSKVFDAILGFRVGKSILAIWQKPSRPLSNVDISRGA